MARSLWRETTEEIPSQNSFFINNIQPHGTWGIMGSGARYGNEAIEAYFSGSAFIDNIIERLPAGGSSSEYPEGNLCPNDWKAVEFIEIANGDFHLKSTSRFRNAGPNGKDIGADIDAVMKATAGVVP